MRGILRRELGEKVLRTKGDRGEYETQFDIYEPRGVCFVIIHDM